jgi:eukaryotic-like serine/threonine-protein kinase
MKRCPKCGKEFENTKLLCSSDGEELIAIKFEPNHSRDLYVGLTIDGKYKLERRIGRGGMGAVYAARHTKFNKQVAIKLLSQDMIEEPTSFDRFQREAEASARIKHPNAVPVTDFGQTEDGIIYLVMEYIDGTSLRRLIEQEQRLAPKRVVDLGRQICSAIAAAHRAGVIHRDLKPDNIMIEMIDNRETARVLDFGIAKLKDYQQRRITETGNVLGTPHYMSPEQCSGAPLDHRSDIYALGVVLYEMISGKLPFDAPSAPAIIVQQVTRDPKPLHEICSDVPEPLARVVMRALEKQPDRRQQTATDLANQLEAAFEIINTPDAMPQERTKPSEVKRWRVIFLGALDNSDEGQRRVIEGLQRGFGLSAESAEDLLKSQRASVKKTYSQEEAKKVAEKLRAIGADVKVEPIVELAVTLPKPSAPTKLNVDMESSGRTKPGLKTALMANTQKISEPIKFDDEEGDSVPTIIASPKEDTSLNNVPQDPLLMTDGSEMLSYITEKARERTAANSPSEQKTGIDTVADGLENRTSSFAEAGNSQNMGQQETTAFSAIAEWSIDMNGFIHEHMSEKDVEAWIRSSRVRITHKVRKGSSNWYDIGTIPQFRRIFKEINPHIFEPLTAMDETEKEEEKRAGNLFFIRLLKLVAVCFSLYVIISFGMQYSQRLLLEDDLRVIMNDSKTTVTTLRIRVRTALKLRDLNVPDSGIHITANPPNRHVSIRVDYSRTLIGIPLHYQAKHESTNFDLPLEQLVQLPDQDIELVGISREDINRYRQEQAMKRAAERLAGYLGEPETVKERKEVGQELQEFEESLRLFEITSADEEGRKSYSKLVKIRGKEYTKEEMKTHVEELKARLLDLDRLLVEQRVKKLETEGQPK